MELCVVLFLGAINRASRWDLAVYFVDLFSMPTINKSKRKSFNYYCRALLILFYCYSCNTIHTHKVIDSICNEATNSKLWVVYNSVPTILVRGGKLDSIKNDYHLIVEAMNHNSEHLKVIIQKKINDTLFVKIDSSIYLTQRMGTTGAADYEAIVVFSLTENKNVTCVYLDFEEGDHGGQPGYFTRNDFKDNFLIKDCGE